MSDDYIRHPGNANNDVTPSYSINRNSNLGPLTSKDEQKEQSNTTEFTSLDSTKQSKK